MTGHNKLVLTEKELKKALKVTQRTIHRWRRASNVKTKLPLPFQRDSGSARIYYDFDAVYEWFRVFMPHYCPVLLEFLKKSKKHKGDLN